MLDAQAGVQYLGEASPQATADDNLAIRAWNHLTNGAQAIDWAGLPLVVELLGITDIEGLMHRLLVIKSHINKEDDSHGTGDAVD